MEKIDISTPLGAWHYASVLARIATIQAEELEEKFSRVKEGLEAKLAESDSDEALALKEWTIWHQRDDLKIKVQDLSIGPEGAVLGDADEEESGPEYDPGEAKDKSYRP